ncbi:hypothetical protein ACH40E_03015 [Streptomyces acidicola]|uniref:hypothetical protein n=1 Tax=Streptomyces acidicola TaxID=2596892 RepID=UPI0037B5BD8D
MKFSRIATALATAAAVGVGTIATAGPASATESRAESSPAAQDVQAAAWYQYDIWGPYTNATSRLTLLKRCTKAGLDLVASGAVSDAICTDDGRYIRLYGWR